jgi:hypothetical protein
MPFKSESQRKLFHAMEGRGEISHAEVHKWETETKKQHKKLPEHVKKHMATGGQVCRACGGPVGESGEDRVSSPHDGHRAVIRAVRNARKAR